MIVAWQLPKISSVERVRRRRVHEEDFAVGQDVTARQRVETFVKQAKRPAHRAGRFACFINVPVRRPRSFAPRATTDLRLLADPHRPKRGPSALSFWQCRSLAARAVIVSHEIDMADAKRIGEMKECYHGRVAPSPLEPTLTYCWMKPEISANCSWVNPFSLRSFPKFRPTSLRISMRASRIFTYYRGFSPIVCIWGQAAFPIWSVPKLRHNRRQRIRVIP